MPKLSDLYFIQKPLMVQQVTFCYNGNSVLPTVKYEVIPSHTEFYGQKRRVNSGTSSWGWGIFTVDRLVLSSSTGAQELSPFSY